MNKKIELSLPSVDDLFTTQEQRDDMKREKIMDISLDDLHPFKNHPFIVAVNEELKDLAKSIKEMGILTPAIARPAENGYELISGHRRKAAAELLELSTIPFIIRDVDDNTATIMMIDSNNQRENLLPSEKAFGYKLKLEALKNQGKRTDLTSSQVDPKSIGMRSNVKISEESGESVKQIQRYIRLTNLIKPIIKMVDEKKMAFNPAVEISYLRKEEQESLFDLMNATQCTPSISQAVRLKADSKEKSLMPETIFEILNESKPNQRERVSFKPEQIKDYFPKEYTAEQMEKKILQLLKADKNRKLEKKEMSRNDER